MTSRAGRTPLITCVNVLVIYSRDLGPRRTALFGTSGSKMGPAWAKAVNATPDAMGEIMSTETPANPPVAGLINRVRNARLPDSYATRWHESRKALVVEAVENGTLRLERALVLYRMSAEEFGTWRDAWERKRQRTATGTPHEERALAFGRRVRGDPSPCDA